MERINLAGLLGRLGFALLLVLLPGGTLGRRLSLTRVEAVMHTGDEIPSVSRKAPLRQLIMEMTSKRLGATCVVDNGKLLGIITDGDLRRLLERQVDLSKIHASDLMTANPKTIEPEALATRAINIMERHSIMQLVVPDPRGNWRASCICTTC